MTQMEFVLPGPLQFVSPGVSFPVSTVRHKPALYRVALDGEASLRSLVQYTLQCPDHRPTLIDLRLQHPDPPTDSIITVAVVVATMASVVVVSSQVNDICGRHRDDRLQFAAAPRGPHAQVCSSVHRTPRLAPTSAAHEPIPPRPANSETEHHSQRIAYARSLPCTGCLRRRCRYNEHRDRARSVTLHGTVALLIVDIAGVRVLQGWR